MIVAPTTHPDWSSIQYDLSCRAVRSAEKDDWKRRWFVLSGNRLSYYESAESRKPKNTLVIAPSARIRPSEVHREHEFELFLGSHTLYAVAESDEVRDKWVRHIANAIAACSPAAAWTDAGCGPVSKEEEVAAAKAAMQAAWTHDETLRDSIYRTVRHAQAVREADLQRQRRLRRPDLLASSTKTPVKRTTSATSMSTLSAFVDGKSNLSLYSWGLGNCGQNGDGRVLPNGQNRPLPVSLPKAKTNITDVAAGSKHAAAITLDGKLLMWGDNSDSQLAAPPGKLPYSARPMAVAAFKTLRVSQVACGTRHSFALTAGGVLWSWGCGPHGQLGLGPTIASTPEPQRLELMDGTERATSFSKVYAGRFTSAAISTTGRLHMWGRNNYGQLGCTAGMRCEWYPASVLSMSDFSVQDVALGDAFSAFIVDGGALMVCGALGITRQEWQERQDLLCWPRFTISFGSARRVSSIAACAGILCIISEHSLYTCGYGWLGGDTSGYDLTEEPTAVSELDLEGTSAVACGPRHIVVLCLDGRVFALGCNTFGALGAGHNSSVLKPVPGILIEGQRIVKVCCGADYTLALAISGTSSSPLDDDVTDLLTGEIMLPENSLLKQKANYRTHWSGESVSPVGATDTTWIPGKGRVFAPLSSSLGAKEGSTSPPPFLAPPPPSFPRETNLATPLIVDVGIEAPAAPLPEGAADNSFKAILEDVPSSRPNLKEPVLPAGWTRFVDKENDPYYYCEATGDATWLLFWELADGDGTPYYMNCETGDTQWERPDNAVIVVAQ